MDKDEAKKILNLEVLAAAKLHYEQALRTWATLDTKAISIISVTGIILAATIAFQKNYLVSLSIFEKIIITIILVTLLYIVFTSLQALWIRKASLSPNATTIRNHVNKIIALQDSVEDNEFIDLSLRSINTISREWEMVSETLMKTIATKSLYIKRAQVTLLCIIMIAMVSLVLKMFLP